MAKSILAKIGEAVKAGAKVIKDVLSLVPKALVYPIRKPFASIDEMKHDARVSLKEAVGINIPKEEKKYDPPIKTTQASEDLGIQITKQEKGKVSFLVSRTLTGDIPYLSPQQLYRIKQDLPNITIFREENKIVVEVDVEKITNDIKADLTHKGKSPEEIKELVLKGIYNKVDCSFKNLAKITGGELKVHTDRKLLYGITRKLYQVYDNQEQRSDTKESVKSVNHKKSSEAINSVSKQFSEAIALSASNNNKVLEAAKTLIDSSEGRLSQEAINWQSTLDNRVLNKQKDLIDKGRV